MTTTGRTGTDGQRTRRRLGGRRTDRGRRRDTTDGQRTDDDGTDDGTDGWTEDDNGDGGTDTTGRTEEMHSSKVVNTILGPILM